MIGKSGVGKTTLTEILFGDASALESTFDQNLLVFKVKNVKEKGGKEEEEHSMFVSDTICPQPFTVQENPGLAIYDCAGFADTRGTSNEIATGVYLSEIVEHAKRVKIVVAVDYDSVKPNADRGKFTDGTIPEVLDFVLNKDIYEGGLFLLVTKYANPCDPLNEFDDSRVVSSIAEFLKAAQKHALEHVRDKERRPNIAALFENSWLKMVDGDYPNVSFSKIIAREGNLSDMDSLTRRLQIRDQLLDNTHFQLKSSDRKDFGCPISVAAKLEIRKALRNMLSEVEELLRTVRKKIVNKFAEFGRNYEKFSSFFSHYVLFMRELEMEKGSGLSSEGLQIVGNFGDRIETEIDSEMGRLKDIYERIKYLSIVDVEESPAIWKEARGKWDEAIARMSENLVTEFRRAQTNLTAEVDSLLKTLSPVVVNAAALGGRAFYKEFRAFSDKRKKEGLGLCELSLGVLGDFGKSIGVDFKGNLEKLKAIIQCLKDVTDVDAEQSKSTWSDVQAKWNHAMEDMEKDVNQVKIQQDLVKAKARGSSWCGLRSCCC